MFRASLLALALLLANCVCQADDRLVVLENDTAIQLRPDLTILTILVKPGKQPIRLDEQPQVAGVYLSGVSVSSQGFAAKWTSNTWPEGIEITLDRGAMVRSGTYDVYLDVQPRSKPDAERLRIQIVHPEPKLNAVPKLLIDRTEIFWGWEDDSQPGLILAESSNLSNLTNISLKQLSNTTLGVKQIGGTLEFTTAPQEIKAGQTARYVYKLANDFGLGTAAGTFAVSAAEMNGPIGTVDFEVHTHLHWIYIGITIAGGLLASYFLKVRLQMKIELDQARLDGRKLRQRVLAEEGKHLDTSFRNAYKRALTMLDTALIGSDPAEINGAKTELDTTWRAALQDLAKRHQEQEALLSKIKTITNTDWIVPPSVRAEISKAKESFAAIEMALENDDLPQVQQGMENILINLGEGIREAASSWQANAAEILDKLLDGPKGISKAVSEKLSKPARDLRDSLNRVSPTTALGTPEQIQQVLSDIKGERIAVAQFFSWLKLAMSTELSTIRAAFAQLKEGQWKPDMFAAIASAEEALANFLATALDSPHGEDLASFLAKLHQAWSSGLLEQPGAPRDKLASMLEERDYQKSADTTLEQLKQNHEMLGKTEKMAPTAITLPNFARDAAPATGTPLYTLQTHFQTLFTADPVTPTVVTEETQLKKDKRWQSLIIGFFLIVLGYSLQLATFVGTFTEISTLFFWAFGLDLTLDTVKTLSAKKT